MEQEEELAVNALKRMSKAELELVDHDKKKWLCHVEGCPNGTTVKDFGIEPEYYSRWGWIKVGVWYFICGKHNKLEKKGGLFLHKPNTVADRIIDK